MKVGQVVLGQVRRTQRGKWRDARLLILQGANAQDCDTKEYYPLGQWIAEGVKVFSDDKWFVGESLKYGEEMFRFGGYTPEGYVRLLNMVLGDTKRTVAPDLVNRPS